MAILRPLLTRLQSLLRYANKSTLCKAGVSIALLFMTLIAFDSAIGLSSSILQLAANFLPLILLWLFLLALTRRFGLSFALGLIVLSSMFIISAAKHKHIGQHLVLQDILLAPTLLQEWDVFSRYTNFWLLGLGLVLLLVIIAQGLRENPFHILLPIPLMIVCFAGGQGIT